MFVDLRVHSLNSKGLDSPARMEMKARELGVELTFCDGFRYQAPCGVELEARSKKGLKREIAHAKNFDIIAVHGGRANINRAAVSDSRVDVLCHPWLGRRDSGVDAVVAREAAENNVAIEFCLSYLLMPGQRLKILSHIRRIMKLGEKYDFPIAFTTGAKTRYDLRSEEELKAVMSLIGFSQEGIEEVLRHQQRLLGGER